jgi:TPR repeat protein
VIMKIKIYILGFILIVISCQSKNQVGFFRELRMEYNVEHKGNIEDYERLKIVYYDYPEGSILPYALIMADKFDYNQAYYDVYEALGNPKYDSIYYLRNLDSLNKKALSYLQKGSIKGCLEAKEVLGEYYLNGLYFPKDTILGKELIKESLKRFVSN